ncbi:peptidyl-prolyl cis-trans isomerase [Treponema sp. OMZ 788]|uniref:MOSP complex formation periplasmic protein, TDE1658 family n=1 Tax=Treponema sp. OMZ 788 TaxID=2563664 RepID=UPI0020A455CB|nr:peptidyl-prolyl cis-trans isomerase [Treponema sp. OMZ 788]UTC65598.1 peptidyl-prolyl cis-trans isomerase [Treponema sp. OMZ 788]
MKKKVFIAVMLVGFLGLLFAQNDLQVIAQVNLSKKEPITLGQLKKLVKFAESQGGVNIVATSDKKLVLESLMRTKLLVQAAEKENIKVANSQVDAEFNNALSAIVNSPITESEFAKMIKQKENISLDEFMKKQTGNTVEEVKKIIKDNLIIQNYITSKNQAEILRMATPTDAQIRAYYEMKKGELVRPDMVKMLFVAVEKKGKDKEELDKINELHKKIKKNIKEIANIKKNSEAGNYVAQEGYIPKTAEGAQLLNASPEALMEIFSKDVNHIFDIQDRVDSRQFFVITEKLDAKILTLSDVPDPSSTITIYDQIKGLISQSLALNAFQSIIQTTYESLRTDDNCKIIKTDSELDKLLNW